jgi:hypothetical protein
MDKNIIGIMTIFTSLVNDVITIYVIEYSNVNNMYIIYLSVFPVPMVKMCDLFDVAWDVSIQ